MGAVRLGGRTSGKPRREARGTSRFQGTDRRASALSRKQTERLPYSRMQTGRLSYSRMQTGRLRYWGRASFGPGGLTIEPRQGNLSFTRPTISH